MLELHSGKRGEMRMVQDKMLVTVLLVGLWILVVYYVYSRRIKKEKGIR